MDDEAAHITKKRRSWEKECLDPVLKKWPESKPRYITTSSVPIDRLYGPDNIPGFDYNEKLGFPGQYPFTRGVQPTMYRGRNWTMRQFSGFGTAEETNERYKYLLDHGETGLSVAFDYPTLYGYDTDHPLAEGEFGKCGVAISHLKDMQLLFKDIDVSKISTSMTINGPAAPVWAFYIASAKSNGIPADQLRGTIQNDILKEYIAKKAGYSPRSPQ